MKELNIRPYEISLWTLQDGFISVLKPYGILNYGQVESPIIKIKDDGTQELTFSVPMYIREKGELIENPFWYDVQQGALLVNLRKLKVIFNKGEEIEEVFEFMIHKITENHSGGKLYCEVFSEGLAFQELGKKGYKISLKQEDFEEDYNNWIDSNDPNKKEPIANLQYWADKIFEDSDWSYSIQMDWAAFDGVIFDKSNEEREAEGLRRKDKIYEEEYVSAWVEKEGRLEAQKVENFTEKARLVNLEKSNKYNLTQDLAKAFEVHCKYKYHYDENYKIIKKEVIFFNNFLNEKEGKIGITYPYDSSKIEREIDSEDVITKLFVVPLEDDTSPSGLLTIADVSANKSKEDYILNFDYLHNIGTISDEQYFAIEDYERSLFLINSDLEDLAKKIAKRETDLVEYEAKLNLSKEGQILAAEQIEQSQDLLNAITDNTQKLSKTKDVPYRAVLLDDLTNSSGKYYVKISQEGVILDSIKIYYKEDVNGDELKRYKGKAKVELDDFGNVIAIRNLELVEKSVSKIYYLTFDYQPALHYNRIIETFTKRLAKDKETEYFLTEKIADMEKDLSRKKRTYDSLIKEKQALIAEFERMMGPALREGSWQEENLKSSTLRGIKDIDVVGELINSESTEQSVNFIWGAPFEDEFNGKEISGVEEEEYFYPYIFLRNNFEEIKDHLDELCFVYRVSEEGFPLEYNYALIGGEAQYVFIESSAIEGEDKNKVIPALVITKDLKNDLPNIQNNEDRFLGIIEYDEEEGKINFKKINSKDFEIHTDLQKRKILYPRVEIQNLNLRTSEDDFSLFLQEKKLEKFYDYSLRQEDEKYYATIKAEAFLRNSKIIDNSLTSKIQVNYAFSKDALSLFLNALQVSKTNAFPKVSYSVDVSSFNKDFMKTAYRNLGRIVNIIDHELKFENIFGYISELELVLESPWEDKIIIKNYKTKFEDLFSSIVASTEQMKSNAVYYNNAASAFTSSGSLKQNIIQNTLNNTDLTYAFRSGELTIDEEKGIWAKNDSGVVAIRGGGIFCATQTDTNGNWLWNTGITPSGINASLLRAGQIDTNLIKIYAGDNLRLQLNQDGLFAYKQNSAGEAKIDEYVVHNSEGLFLKQPKGEKEISFLSSEPVELVNRVEISWDGLILRNKEGNEVFYADPNTGNLTLKGFINAAGGDIGGWKIEENKLSSKNTPYFAQIQAAPDDPEKKIFDMLLIQGEEGANSSFRVQSDGTMYAKNAHIAGTLTANTVFAGNATMQDIYKQIKELSLSAFNGTVLRVYNRNLTGDLNQLENQLGFRIFINALTKDELTPNELTEENSKWYYTFSSPDGNLTEEIDFTDLNSLTFQVPYDKIKSGGTVLKVSKLGKTTDTDENGFATESSIDKTYTASVNIRKEEYYTDVILGNIEPNVSGFAPGNFTGKTFTVNLTYGKNSQPAEDELLFKENYSWVLNGKEVELGKSSIEIDRENSVQTFKLTLQDEDESLFVDGVSTLQFIIKDDSSNVFATRTAQISRIQLENINVVIKSSNGLIFKNGNLSTILNVELYSGKKTISTDGFYFVWIKKEGDSRELVGKKEDVENAYLEIKEKDFTSSASYTCDVYDNRDEAEAAWK